jgi:hypothetical protein
MRNEEKRGYQKKRGGWSIELKERKWKRRQGRR